MVLFGAGVTILPLAFDPFMQQILSYPARLMALPDSPVVVWQSNRPSVLHQRSERPIRHTRPCGPAACRVDQSALLLLVIGGHST
jgi:hypothetical protein